MSVSYKNMQKTLSIVITCELTMGFKGIFTRTDDEQNFRYGVSRFEHSIHSLLLPYDITNLFFFNPRKLKL